MNNCSICLESLDSLDYENGCYKIKECGHSFHADCFFTWCKQGVFSCPLCRTDCKSNLNFMDKRQKLSYLRKISLKKNSPPMLKELAQKHRDNEKKTKQLNKELKDYIREHKVVFDTLAQKRSELFRCFEKNCKSKDNLLGFPVLELPNDFRLVKRN